MLTTERISALQAVRDGAVSARLLSAPGSPLVYTPREQTVALSFLRKAGLIETVVSNGQKQTRPVTVELTARGEYALTKLHP